MNDSPIDTLYVFLSVDEGGEGICAGKSGNTFYPMVVSRAEPLAGMKEQARQLSKASGVRIVLAEFKRNGPLLWQSD